ncbi:type II toxin-antitoxin system Phd/YefM family antitoxin [Kaistia sp. MMO-174]|uniref:type II toxin-antitoxin system Phd/YefM family antitoxin n=1 Tax=Kaistia sp. MMO-174 TaxID=3081256 RepID=UPI0030195EE2
MKNCETYTASEARENLSEIINKALYKNPVIITRRKEAVAVIPLELLNRITDLEAKYDAELAATSLEEFDKTGGITLKRLKEELGM